MEHYNEHELDAKIHAFLTDKLDKYPELDTKKKSLYTAADQSASTHFTGSFNWFKSLATH